MPNTKRQDLAGEVGLACAVLALAARDVRKANGHAQEARRFLSSTWAADLLREVCGVLDLDYTADDLAALIDGRASRGDSPHG